MSSTPGPDTPAFAANDPTDYVGSERYWKTAEKCLGMRLTPEQRTLHETVADNRYTFVEGANSFGKTYGMLGLSMAFWLRHYPASVMVTSGTYGKLKRTFCDPLEDIHTRTELDRISAWKWSPNPHIDAFGEPTWQFEVASPEDAGELEGVHNNWTLAIIEEADKDAVDDEVIDSMESLVSDKYDRMIVVANPPKDEVNIVNELREDPKYHNVNFSTWDSHNVKIELGEREGTMVPGLATLDKLKDDWESYNVEPWPGVTKARYAHDRTSPHFRNDLDVRWYRRRGGVLPPDTAGEHRPIYTSEIQDAWERDPDPDTVSARPTGVAVDVGSSSDRTVLAAVYGSEIRIVYSHKGAPNPRQRKELWDRLDEWGHFPPIAVDAIGVGTGLAEDTMARYDTAHDFKANRNACQVNDYKDYWTEALAAFGDWLRSGGSIHQHNPSPQHQTSLKRELETTARTISYETKYYKDRDTDVLVAEGRDDLKERLGHSPDHADAAIMALWAHTIEDPSEYETGQTVTRVFRV